MGILDIGAGASEGLDSYLQEMLKREQFEQMQENQRGMLAEATRHNTAGEGIQRDQLASIAADRAALATDRADDNKRLDAQNIVANAAVARDDGRALGDIIPGDTFLEETDPAIKQMEIGGVGNLLKKQESRPAVDVGPLQPGDTGKERREGRIKLRSHKQTDDLADNKRLEQKDADDRAQDVRMANRPQGQNFVTFSTPEGQFIANKSAGTAKPIEMPDGSNAPLPSTSTERQRLDSMKRVKPFIDGVSELSARINTKPGVAALVEGSWSEIKAKANMDDDVAEYVALVEAFTPLLARALGHSGVLTEPDFQHSMAILPKPRDSESVKNRKLARLEKTFGIGADGGGAGAGGAEPAGGKVDLVFDIATGTFKKP